MLCVYHKLLEQTNSNVSTLHGNKVKIYAWPFNQAVKYRITFCAQMINQSKFDVEQCEPGDCNQNCGNKMGSTLDLLYEKYADNHKAISFNNSTVTLLEGMEKQTR